MGNPDEANWVSRGVGQLKPAIVTSAPESASDDSVEAVGEAAAGTALA